MFQSYTRPNRSKGIEIIDDEFVAYLDEWNLWNAVIDTYEARQLDVVPNLFRAIVFHAKRFSMYPDTLVLTTACQYILSYRHKRAAEYIAGLEKYLLLM